MTQEKDNNILTKVQGLVKIIQLINEIAKDWWAKIFRQRPQTESQWLRNEYYVTLFERTARNKTQSGTMLKIKCYCFKTEGKGWIFRFSEALKKSVLSYQKMQLPALQR